MKIKEQSDLVPPKNPVRFLTGKRPLPKSLFGDAGTGSSGGGITDSRRDAVVPLAAIQINGGARAPPTCLIVQRSMPDCDPVAPFTNCSSVRNFSEFLSVPFRSQSNIQPDHLNRTK